MSDFSVTAYCSRHHIRFCPDDGGCPRCDDARCPECGALPGPDGEPRCACDDYRDLEGEDIGTDDVRDMPPLLKGTAMNFKTHNEKPDIETNGTHLLGEIDADYKNLVAKFGKPGEGDAYKVDVEWAIEFEDGTVATVYNYKDGRNYCGDEGTPTEEIRDWHIGGVNPKAVALIKGVLANDPA